MKDRILIVEDVPFGCFPLRDNLRQMFPQIQFDVAESGMMAVVCLKKHEYDLVISDQDADEMTRFWLYHVMRQSHPTTPLLIFTDDPNGFRGKVDSTVKAIIPKTDLPLLICEVEKARH